MKREERPWLNAKVCFIVISNIELLTTILIDL